jgi:hypothetical protein
MLNHAAALSRILPRALGRPILISVTAFAALSMAASSATALDGIDLSVAATPTADGECSRLVQIKYPFLSCMNGEIGQSAANETWANSRHLPIQSDWIEGDSAWGPTLNPVDAAE